MNSKIVLLVSGFIVIYFLSQVAECKSGSRVMKYGKAVTKKLSRYTKPLLMGTEKTAGKLTRDVRVASRFTARNAINGMLVVNKRLSRVLRFAKKRVGKKKKKGAAPPPPPPAPEPAPVVEETKAEAAPEEHHDEPEPEEHHDEPATEEHHDEPATEEHHDEPAADEHHDEEPAADEHHDEPAADEHHDESATETAVEHTDEKPA